LRASKFKKFHDLESFIGAQNDEIKKSLVWNSDMAIALVDSYIFISGHLSSKA
jgi:hypothetical protein